MPRSPFAKLSIPSLPWLVTIGYLLFLLVLPITALLNQAFNLSPQEFWTIATDPVAVSAYRVTFVTAFSAALINGLMGTIIAWVLVRYEFPGRKAVDALLDLPFALPTAVAGVLLATLYSETGWVGQFFAPFGIKIAFTRLGVWVAMIFISLPFIVRTVQPVLQELEPEVEEAARSLGATPWQTVSRVVLPPLFPSILTGMTLGFSRAVGEYGSVVIISSGIPFRDLIAPVLIFQRLEQYDYSGASVVGIVLLAIALLLIFLVNRLQQWGQRYAG